MKTKHLLSSLGIHLLAIALLHPFIASKTPPRIALNTQVDYVELQQVSPASKKNFPRGPTTTTPVRLEPIEVTEKHLETSANS